MVEESGKKSVSLRKPSWLLKKITYSAERHELKKVLHNLGLNTVCESARCPNLSECFYHKRATFLILGSKCTRNCLFCSVKKAAPGEIIALDENEPARICEAVRAIGLEYVVITSVTRDDLNDGGALQFAKTIKKLREYSRSIRIEVLTPDFQGSKKSFDTVLESGPDVFNHNIETVPRLYERIRPEADYERSLEVLKYAKESYPEIFVKSGFMVGLGETEVEVLSVLKDLKESGCDAVTIGQYLRPGQWNVPVYEYVTPEKFYLYEDKARKIGFSYVASGPFVRSSYLAHRGYENLLKNCKSSIDMV